MRFVRKYWLLIAAALILIVVAAAQCAPYMIEDMQRRQGRANVEALLAEGRYEEAQEEMILLVHARLQHRRGLRPLLPLQRIRRLRERQCGQRGHVPAPQRQIPPGTALERADARLCRYRRRGSRSPQRPAARGGGGRGKRQSAPPTRSACARSRRLWACMSETSTIRRSGMEKYPTTSGATWTASWWTSTSTITTTRTARSSTRRAPWAARSQKSGRAATTRPSPSPPRAATTRRRKKTASTPPPTPTRKTSITTTTTTFFDYEEAADYYREHTE